MLHVSILSRFRPSFRYLLPTGSQTSEDTLYVTPSPGIHAFLELGGWLLSVVATKTQTLLRDWLIHCTPCTPRRVTQAPFEGTTHANHVTYKKFHNLTLLIRLINSEVTPQCDGTSPILQPNAMMHVTSISGRFEIR